LGSGGGAGSNDGDVSTYSGAGGAGGGIVLIYTPEFSGTVYSHGEDGEPSSWGDSAEPGGSGGGAGGTIYIYSSDQGSSTYEATGGLGGEDGAQDEYPTEDCDGGDGGDGRVRLDYSSFSGTSDPAVGYTGSSPPSFKLISTTEGYTPFYTTTANPMFYSTTACLASMVGGNTCDTQWVVNASGPVNTTWDFFSKYIAMNYSNNISLANTSLVSISIITNNAPVASNVNILPSEPVFSEDLNCSFIVSDSGSLDSLTANISWYNNSVLAYSESISVSNGVQTSRILGSGNTTTGEEWYCAVTPYDQIVYGTQVNSSTVTILSSKPPEINQVQCYRNNSEWVDCTSLVFGEVFSGVRTNCTGETSTITNVTYNFTNVPDSQTYFDTTVTSGSGDWWYNYENITHTNTF